MPNCYLVAPIYDWGGVLQAARIFELEIQVSIPPSSTVIVYCSIVNYRHSRTLDLCINDFLKF